VTGSEPQTTKRDPPAAHAGAETAMLLDSVLKNMSHGIIVYDKGGLLRVHNPRFAEMYGLIPEELQPGTHRDIVAASVVRRNWPDKPVHPLSFLESGLNQDEAAATARVEIELDDGRIHERLAFKLPDGGLVATHTDITSHKRSQREALDKSLLLELTLESVDQGILVHDSEQIVLANSRYATLLRIPESLLGEGQRIEDLDAHQKQLGTAAPSLREEDRDAFEAQQTDGSWLSFDFRKLSNGLRVWTVSDVTERKRTEASIQEQSEILQNVFDNVAQGLAAYDSDSRVITWNKKYQEFLILEDHHIYRGCPVWDLVMLHAERGTYGPGEREELEKHVQARIDQLMSGEQVHFDYVNAHGIQMEAISAPRPQGGFVVTYADITERKKAEAEIIRTKDEAEAANQAKSSFLAAMSHEIRTPMNGVLGLIEVLQNTELNEDQRILTSTVNESAMTLLTIIDDILDFSKIEAGRLALESVPVALRRTVELVLDTVGQTADHKGLDLIAEFAGDLPHAVMGDPVRLRQILLNLVGNAVKFTETGAVRARIESGPHPTDPAMSLVTFSIEDTGLGISEANQAKLFQPFSQAEATTTRRFGGTGLGLSISHRLVELMDGEIGVRSTEGKGATFWFTVPLAPVEITEITETIGTTGGPGTDFSGIAVILVSNSSYLRASFERRTHDAGMMFTGVETGLAATALVDEMAATTESPTIVMVDDRLDAAHVTTVLKKAGRSEASASTRSILIRGPVNTQVEADLPSAFHGVISRPVHKDALLRTIGIVAHRINPTAITDTSDEVGLSQTIRVPSVEDALDQGRLILVAEDNATNRMLVQRQLTLLGYQAEYAEDGDIALDLWHEKAYGLVLTDCHMPNMDGFELTRKIRGVEAGTGSHVPIIALTANALVGEAERCLGTGMDDYLAKPATLRDMGRVLGRWLPRHAEDLHLEDFSGEPIEPGPQAPIDKEMLVQLFGGTDKEILGPVLESYEISFGEALRLIELARADEDRVAFKRAVHMATGSSSSIGAMELTNVLKRIEDAAMDQDWKDIDALRSVASARAAAVLAYLEGMADG
jgi:signal transduction histidine kinase/CheY-like chemotaxis protein